MSVEINKKQNLLSQEHSTQHSRLLLTWFLRDLTQQNVQSCLLQHLHLPLLLKLNNPLPLTLLLHFLFPTIPPEGAIQWSPLTSQFVNPHWATNPHPRIPLILLFSGQCCQLYWMASTSCSYWLPWASHHPISMSPTALMKTSAEASYSHPSHRLPLLHHLWHFHEAILALCLLSFQLLGFFFFSVD